MSNMTSSSAKQIKNLLLLLFFSCLVAVAAVAFFVYRSTQKDLRIKQVLFSPAALEHVQDVRVQKMQKQRFSGRWVLIPMTQSDYHQLYQQIKNDQQSAAWLRNEESVDEKVLLQVTTEGMGQIEQIIEFGSGEIYRVHSSSMEEPYWIYFRRKRP